MLISKNWSWIVTNHGWLNFLLRGVAIARGELLLFASINRTHLFHTNIDWSLNGELLLPTSRIKLVMLSSLVHWMRRLIRT